VKCSHCSHENADDFLFCEDCGERLGKECPECGHANSHDFAFCENCGHKFVDEPDYVPASEELVPEATPSIPTTKKKETIIAPEPVEAVPAQASPVPQVVVVQQEERGRLPGWLWPVVGLLAIIVFFIIIAPRQPSYQPDTSSSGQSVSSGSGGSSGQSSGSSEDSSSSGQSSGSSGDNSSSGQSGSSSEDSSSSGQSNGDNVGDSGSSDPTFTADQETNCRYGPSASDFDVRRTVFNGQTVPIVGKGASPAQEWWVLVVDGVQCWVWSGLGEVNGDTAGLASINPPEVPVAEAEQDEPEQDEEEEEQADSCPVNPTVTVTPLSGPPEEWFEFTLFNFGTDVDVTYKIVDIGYGDIIASGDLHIGENGIVEFSYTWSDISWVDEIVPGQYVMDVSGPLCDSVWLVGKAVFIIE